METTSLVVLPATRSRYATVNGTWPMERSALPRLTAEEAAKAFRLLYRHRFDESYDGRVVAVKGRHRRTWSGGFKTSRVKGRLVRVRHFNVAPDAGWHSFIHDLSHWIHRRQYPGQAPHRGSSHAAVEMDLIEQVVARGWLEGKLKRAPKVPVAKPKPDVRARRRDGVLAKIKSWESKRKRAETALKKLRRQARYYERSLAAPAGAV